MARKQKIMTETAEAPVETAQENVAVQDNTPPVASVEERLSNFLASELGAVREAQEAADANAAGAFENFLKMGSHLATMKKSWEEAGGKARAFNVWAEANVADVSKQWRNRLIQLASNWQDIAPCVEGIAPEKLTVDGALAAWRASKAVAAVEGGEGEGGEAAPVTIKSLSKADLRDLAEMMAEHLRRIVAAKGVAEAVAEAGDFLAAHPELAVAVEGEAQEGTQEEPEGQEEVAEEPTQEEPEAPVEAAPLAEITKAQRNRGMKLVRERDAAQEAGDADTAAALWAKLGELASKSGRTPEAFVAALAA